MTDGTSYTGAGFVFVAVLAGASGYILKEILGSDLVDKVRRAASGAIVQAILAMAGHLRMAVTVEGVESEQQLARLRELGSPQVQGFLLGRPLAPHDTAPVALDR